MGEQTLPPFPVDDGTLNLLEHAMRGAYRVDLDGEHHLVGADFSMTDLFRLLSGYDPALLIPLDSDDVMLYTGGPVYDERSVIRALITEVRRLRAQLPLDDASPMV